MCLLSWSTFLNGSDFLHPFYVSTTEIALSQQRKSVEVAIRVFSNDLEKELTHVLKHKTDLLNEKLQEENLVKLQKYFGQTFELKADKQKLNLRLIGFEHREESTWIYLESELPGKPKEIEVVSSLLYQTQKKQVNLIRLKTEKSDRTEKLEYPESKVSFSLF